jgi:nondiscriminating glutamyl-tRNA synthetase
LLDKGLAYYCFCTKEELDAEREEALRTHGTPKYSRKCTHLTKEEIDKKLADGLKPAIRLRLPDNHNYE